MPEEKIILTPEETLVVCNMTSTGTKLSDAIAKIKTQRSGVTSTATTEKGKKKVSLKDKKSVLAKEIEALGGEVPATFASVAKFEEALTAAKAAKAHAPETDDLM